MKGLYPHCDLRKFYSLFKAWLQCLSSHKATCNSRQFSCSQLFVSLQGPIPCSTIIRFIHPSNHATIYPPKNYINKVKDCLSKSLDTKSVHTKELVQDFFCYAPPLEKYIILLSKLKKICRRSWCMGKECTPLGICEY